MVCPFCNAEDTAVIDSRRNSEGSSVRRRRKCSKCESRFTTYEKTEIYIVKKDDNLWKIAEKYKQNNKEEFILAIKELNKLENSRLYINQKLIVP